MRKRVIQVPFRRAMDIGKGGRISAVDIGIESEVNYNCKREVGLQLTKNMPRDLVVTTWQTFTCLAMPKKPTLSTERTEHTTVMGFATEMRVNMV